MIVILTWRKQAGKPENPGATERFQVGCRARRELVSGALAGRDRRRVVAEIWSRDRRASCTAAERNALATSAVIDAYPGLPAYLGMIY